MRGAQACARSTSSLAQDATTTRSSPRSPRRATTTASSSCPASTPSRRRAQKPTDDPRCDQYEITNDRNQAGAVSYAYQFHCPNDQNLIAVIGRAAGPGTDPQPPLGDRRGIPNLGRCIRCNFQIEGSGVSADDVVVDAGRVAPATAGPGDRPVKDVAIRADRADGFVLRNITVRHAARARHLRARDRRLRARPLQGLLPGEYGVLTFTSDHGLIQNCEAAGSRRRGPLSGLGAGHRRAAHAGHPVPLHTAGPPLRHAPQRRRLLGDRRQRGPLPPQQRLRQRARLHDRRLHRRRPPRLPAGLRPGRAQQLLLEQLQPLRRGLRRRADGPGAGRHGAVDRGRQQQRDPQQPLLGQLAPRHR